MGTKWGPRGDRVGTTWGPRGDQVGTKLSQMSTNVRNNKHVRMMRSERALGTGSRTCCSIGGRNHQTQPCCFCHTTQPQLQLRCGLHKLDHTPCKRGVSIPRTDLHGLACVARRQRGLCQPSLHKVKTRPCVEAKGTPALKQRVRHTVRTTIACPIASAAATRS